jgi:hypothetical protein
VEERLLVFPAGLRKENFVLKNANMMQFAEKDILAGAAGPENGAEHSGKEKNIGILENQFSLGTAVYAGGVILMESGHLII